MTQKASARWYAWLAVALVVITLSQLALAVRRGSLVDWLLAAAGAVLGGAYARRWLMLSRGGRQTP